MSSLHFLLTAWRWNPLLLAGCAVALAAHMAVFGLRWRTWWFVAALAVLLIALVSPLAALADGYLFSAHMTQHMLLQLIVPAFLLSSLPRSLAFPQGLEKAAHPVLCWLCGVGAMWLWHAPVLCNAAGSSRAVFALQVVSLLVIGTGFWLKTAAPLEHQRLTPPAAVVYLFTACVACSVLGMIITFSPVNVCSIYAAPIDRLGLLDTIRAGWGMSAARDQQTGGLLMWVPMCTIYICAIFAQLSRWYGAAVVGPVHAGTTQSHL
jgi:putative membrane protein